MLIKNCRCFDGEKFLDGLVNILIENDTVTAVESIETEIKTDGAAVDAMGRTVCPGYVDIHTHGIGGYDNSKLSSEDLRKMSALYYKAGTLIFYPSFPTISLKLMLDSLEMYNKNKSLIPGIHLEGPYINIEKRGAQNPVYIQRPNIERFKEEFEEYFEIISRITIAPEMDENFKFIEFLNSENIKISFGHTVCDSDLAGEFFDKTDAIATHTFNAMPSIHHRSPSITTVALNRENVYCEIIPDMLHVHPEVVKLLFKVKGPGKTISVSDSMPATGLPDGKYDFSGLQVTVDKTGARLAAGNLAGSTITLAEGVKRLIKIGIHTEHALMSATSTPAKAMGIQKKTGYLKKDRKADLLILNKDFSVSEVYKNGKKI